MYFLGIDPGQKGGATLLDDHARIVCRFAFTKKTEHDIGEWLQEITEGKDCLCYIEKVHSMPKQGVASSFRFGLNYGFLRGLLTGLKIPFDFVTPAVWQRRLECMSRGDKNVTKSKAQRMYPAYPKITHAIADSILIARFCYQFGLR